jgi:hypothetical protein
MKKQKYMYIGSNYRFTPHRAYQVSRVMNLGLMFKDDLGEETLFPKATFKQFWKEVI